MPRQPLASEFAPDGISRCPGAPGGARHDIRGSDPNGLLKVSAPEDRALRPAKPQSVSAFCPLFFPPRKLTSPSNYQLVGVSRWGRAIDQMIKGTRKRQFKQRTVSARHDAKSDLEAYTTRSRATTQPDIGMSSSEARRPRSSGVARALLETGSRYRGNRRRTRSRRRRWVSSVALQKATAGLSGGERWTYHDS